MYLFLDEVKEYIERCGGPAVYVEFNVKVPWSRLIPTRATKEALAAAGVRPCAILDSIAIGPGGLTKSEMKRGVVTAKIIKSVVVLSSCGDLEKLKASDVTVHLVLFLPGRPC